MLCILKKMMNYLVNGWMTFTFVYGYFSTMISFVCSRGLFSITGS